MLLRSAVCITKLRIKEENEFPTALYVIARVRALGFPTQSARFSRSHDPWLKYGRIALDGNAGNQSEILPRHPLQTATLAVRAGRLQTFRPSTLDKCWRYRD